MVEEQPMTDFYRKQAKKSGCPSNQDWMSCTARGFYMLYKNKDYSGGDRDRIANLQQFCKECKALDAVDFQPKKREAYSSDSSEVSSEGEGGGKSKKRKELRKRKKSKKRSKSKKSSKYKKGKQPRRTRRR